MSSGRASVTIKLARSKDPRDKAVHHIALSSIAFVRVPSPTNPYHLLSIVRVLSNKASFWESSADKDKLPSTALSFVGANGATRSSNAQIGILIVTQESESLLRHPQCETLGGSWVD